MCDVCGHIACVCKIQKIHDEDCKFRVAATCPAAIECDHGYDVCPICDPCTCSSKNPEEPKKAPEQKSLLFGAEIS